jgi:ferrochelatase
MKDARIGILLSQLGTPDAPETSALRRYLRQFLGDPRVVEINRVLWWLILNLFILPIRPRQSAALYKKVWTPQGSPLLTITRAQTEKLEKSLGDDRIKVVPGMRYGNPSIRSAIEKLCEWGADRILVFPMYPQYAGATTASTYDEVFRWLPRRRVVPALRIVPPYYDHPAYIEAVAQITRECIESLPWKPDLIIQSFHGIPLRYVESGDPYRDQAEATAARIASSLGLKDDKWLLTFQSRFGREEWLQPYTDKTLMRLGKEGVHKVAVLCPGFTADCLETIEEIGGLGAEQFQEGGGEELRQIPCVNDHPAWIEGMKKIVLQELGGWMDP